MDLTPLGDDHRPIDLDRFLADLRGTGTVITGPVAGEPESPWDDDEPWLVTSHRGTPADPPYRLALEAHEFRTAVERDARVIESWWAGGDARERAHAALLLSFDAALVGIDRTPHAFVLEGEDRVRLTTHHPCPGYLQDALGDAFGGEVFQRFSAYLKQNGSPSTVELAQVMHAEDERFDAFLDALAGEPRDG